MARWLVVAGGLLLVACSAGRSAPDTLSERLSEPLRQLGGLEDVARSHGLTLRATSLQLDKAAARQVVFARQGEVGHAAFRLEGDASELSSAVVGLLLYDAETESAAERLWTADPPERAHRDVAYNFAALAGQPSRRVIDGWRIATPEADGPFRWQTICLASPPPDQPAEGCFDLYGWVQFCHYVLEVRLQVDGPRSVPVTDQAVPSMLQAAASDVAHGVACSG